MSSKKAYALDYAYQTSPKKEKKVQEDFKVIKSNKKKTAKLLKQHAKFNMLIASTVVFTMLMIISYRCNVITEKNFEIQKLEKELSSVNALYTAAEINLNKNSDVSYIEAYAKQQLGMQRPEKNQIIYINSEAETSVNKITEDSKFLLAFQKIKQAIINII